VVWRYKNQGLSKNVAKCNSRGKGINSTYIRHGTKGLLSKVGYYCSSCDAYYDLLSDELYTVNEKTVYSSFDALFDEQQMNVEMSAKREPWPGFGPGTFALPRQRSTRLSYQGADTKRI
jgi:hypothetical protein